MGTSQILRLCSIAGAFLVGFWLPIRLIGFVPPVALEVCFDLLISAVSAVNIVLALRERGRGLTVGMALDFICLMPLSLVAFLAFDATWEWVLLLNLLTVRHIRQIKPFLDHFDSLQPMTYRLIPLLTMVPLLVHLAACGWIALGSGSAGPDADPVMEYIRAVYWAFTTLSTVGYGDISAKTAGQMIYSCVVQLAGVGVFGYILSNVASLLSRSDAAREHHMDNLDKVETFMNLHHTPPDLKSKIRAYYHYLWTNKKGYRDQSLLDGLPARIQSELFFHINRGIIEKVPFFRGADEEMLEDLMNELEPRIFVPGERIFRIDEHGDALYFIQSGEVEILNREHGRIVLLGEGSFFGEMALLSDKPRSATARAVGFCDVYSLHREAFTRVISAYPEFREHMADVAAERAGDVRR